MEHLIKVHCLRHVYPDKTEVNICGLDFVVNPGERVVILGKRSREDNPFIAYTGSACASRGAG